MYLSRLFTPVVTSLTHLLKGHFQKLMSSVLHRLTLPLPMLYTNTRLFVLPNQLEDLPAGLVARVVRALY